MPSTLLSKVNASRVDHYINSGDCLDVPVSQIMTPGVVTIPEDASLRHIYRAMTAHQVHAILVVGRANGTPLGWVTSRGLLAWLGADGTLVAAQNAITKEAVMISPSATAREALEMMKSTGANHLLVTNAPDKHPEGVVSEVDLLVIGTI